MTQTQDAAFNNQNLGRNEPCPCGSGKKYKRCHGVSAAPKLSTPAQASVTPPAGFDPSKMDPAMMGQVTQMLSRLPKGQLQKLQSIMQKAMSGKDVSREAQELEGSLPVDLQEMMKSFAGSMMASGAMPGMAAAAEPTGEMSPEEARRIVEEAAREGKLSESQAQDLLSSAPAPKKGISGFLKNLTKK